MLRLTLFAVIFSVVYSATIKVLYNIEEAEKHFNDFVRNYNKNYANAEERQRRLEIFTENLWKINRLNALNPYAVFGITKLADLTEKEIGLIPFKNVSDFHGHCKPASDISTNAAPDSFDWRSKNAVTSVKDQKGCGSCYTFSTVGNIEGQYAIKKGQLIDFSEQQLVDCSQRNQGCSGGWMAWAMSDVIDSKGIETEKDYPYTGDQGSCAFDASKAKVQLQGCQYFSLQDENKLKDVLYSTGPLAIAIDATIVQNYQSGIITSCSFNALNHAVLLVGYGTEQKQDYWLIKNSWGSSAGEKGYFRLIRNKNCTGILNNAMSSVIVA